MKKLICIVGPTASGKSDLAVEIAKKIDGEVISADSRQVYVGLDIGSGKITQEEMKGVPHHMLDVADPQDIYSVQEFQKDAQEILENIWSSHATPILCGGTGQYIEAIVDNVVFPQVPPNPELREKLEKLSLQELQDSLENLDPDRFDTIDIHNKVRLIRAVEIATALGKVPTLHQNPADFDVMLVGIQTDKEKLAQRIHDRIHARVQAGMLEEVEQLQKEGLSWERLEALGLEYRYISYFLQNKMTKEEMLEKLETEIRRYAKRQMTWFKRDERIKWFSLEEKEEIFELVEKFL